MQSEYKATTKPDARVSAALDIARAVRETLKKLASPQMKLVLEKTEDYKPAVNELPGGWELLSLLSACAMCYQSD